MTGPTRHQRVTRLFLEVVDLGPEERARRLDAECAADSPTRLEVERMLAHDRAASGLLDDPIVNARVALQPGLPARLGAFSLRRVIGRGGMGTVYEAEQDEPRRVVALKVVNPWLGTPELVRRFERETQLLRRLDHPGIARLLDAGVVETAIGSQPYFAMELIEGRPITEQASRASMTARARVELLAAVCDAVEHAHERGIVHRDLKPANVLVDADGAPHVVDFGIARAIDAPDLTTLATESRAILGTLQYMSPEQAAGRSRDVDARSDVYALGALGYELLTGSAPLDVMSRPIVDALRVIAESDPVPAGERDGSLRGDVETILAKMLEKDPARRYASAAAAAADLRRHLANEPITARPESAIRQIRKYARRHRALVAGLVATIVSLLIGLVVSVHFAVMANRDRVTAVAQRQAAQREAYRADMLLASHAANSGNSTECRRLLDVAPAALRGFEWRHLNRSFDASLVHWSRLGGSLHRLAFAADGTHVTAAFSDHSLRSFDFGRWSMEPGADPGADVPDDSVRIREFPRLVLDLPERGEVVLWQAEDFSLHALDRRNGEDRTLARDVHGAIYIGAYSRASARVAAVDDGRFVLWNAEDGSRILEVPVLRAVSYTPAFDADGRRLAFVNADNHVVIVDAITGATRASASCEPPPRRMAFSPDGDLLAVSCETGGFARDNRVLLMDAGSLATRTTLSGYTALLRSLAFAPDGRTLATGTLDLAIRLWDVRSGACRAIVRGPRSSINGLAFSPDSKLLAAGSSDGSLAVFDVRDAALDPEVLRGHRSYVYPVAFDPNGVLLASGSWDHEVRLWDVRTGAHVATLRGHEEYVHDVAFRPDGAVLLTTSLDLTCRLWSTSTGREIGRITLPRAADVNAVAWSPDGKSIALGSSSREREFWIVDAATGVVRASPRIVKGYVRALKYAPDGSALAMADANGRVLLLDPANGEIVSQIAMRNDHGNSLTFAPGGDRLAVACENGGVDILDARTLASRTRLSGHFGEAFAVAWSPDGSRVVSGGRDGLLRLWDPETGDEVAELTGHADYVYSVAFSPDGGCIASGSGDGTVRLWDTAPQRVRLFAGREMEAARADARALVATLRAELVDPERVAERLEHAAGVPAAAARTARLELLREASGTLDDPPQKP